jgi:hypothetical protein
LTFRLAATRMAAIMPIVFAHRRRHDPNYTLPQKTIVPFEKIYLRAAATICGTTRKPRP